MTMLTHCYGVGAASKGTGNHSGLVFTVVAFYLSANIVGLFFSVCETVFQFHI